MVTLSTLELHGLAHLIEERRRDLGIAKMEHKDMGVTEREREFHRGMSQAFEVGERKLKEIEAALRESIDKTVPMESD